MDRVRVVLVSPGDVAKERDLVRAVLEELNRTVAGGRLSLWRWEADARPGMHLHGPQGLIDELMDIRDADLVVGVFWKRFGTPTAKADSGTEHELRRAWAAWSEQGHPDVMVYFCTRPYMPTTRAETDQWGRVLEFRQQLPRQQLWWTYTKPREFQALLREHVTRYLLDHQPTPDPSQATGKRVRFNVPAVAASFTGRQRELDAISEALAVTDSAMVTQAIGGLGGIGKTQLAARYVQLHADEYEIVAWIRAEDDGVADFSQLAAKVGAPAAELSPSDRAQLALDWLGQTGCSWLLVLDNIDGPEQLVRLRPTGGAGRLLVTSRDRALREFGPVLTLDVFDEDTATRYLTQRAGRSEDHVAARELARALGLLPLALSHAGAYCQDGTSFSEYQALLTELPAREQFDSHRETAYEQTVASTWHRSIQAAGRAAPLARSVLELAAHFAPDAIPKALFAVLANSESARDRKRLTDAFNALARYSLATITDTTVSVHRLLQKVVRDDIAVCGEYTVAWRALSAIADAFPSDVELPAHWPACEQLLAHALALTDTVRDPGEHALTLVAVLNRACRYLTRAEPGGRGVQAAQRAHATAEGLLDSEHPQTLNTRGNLGNAYLEAGHTEDAIAIYEPLLFACERVLGPEHSDTLGTRNNLASAYLEAARIEDAIALYEPLFTTRERVLGSEHADTLGTRNNLASAYRAAGRTEDAIAIYEPLLSTRERVQGPKHPDTLSTRNNLANAYLAAGRIEGAIAIYEPLLSTQERVLGPEHPETLRTRNNLARAYQHARRTEDAITIYEPLLSTRERVLGPEHPHTLRTRNNLANAYLAVGRIEDAIAILEPLLSTQERVLGPEHPETLRTRNNVARGYQEAGRTEDAIAIYEPLLRTRERVLGPEHPDALRTRSNLGNAYLAVGCVQDAIATYKPLLSTQECVLGPEHPETLRTRNNLALAYQGAERLREHGTPPAS